MKNQTRDLFSITRRLKGAELFAIAALICVLLIPSKVAAETTTAAAGVTFEAPTGLIIQTTQPPPIVMAWKDANNSLSVSVVCIPSSSEHSLEAAKEYQDWPGAGRSFVDGFGQKNIDGLEKVLKTTCSFVGVPGSRDAERMGVQAEIETSCNTTPKPFVLRSRLIQILTRSNIVLFRIDSNPSADAKAQAITENIWQSIRIADEQKLLQQHSNWTQESFELNAKPVTGGHGIKIRDYGLIRMAALAGMYAGGLVSGILFGMLLTMFLMKVKIRPVPALFGGQVLVTLLRVLGDEKNGAWEIDPILYVVTGAVSIIVLYKWAQRRWAKAESIHERGPEKDGSLTPKS